ncbi:MAG: helix-turn-helix domain-containing protein [Polyangiaceae bacterium]|nr:helix-turn-helix domain-containing protein [Polyangiaceae bacterium]
MKTHYTLLSGKTIDLPALPADLAAFLLRVVAASKDPAVSERELGDLVLGPENPLLDAGVVPGRTVVTAGVYRDPVFHVMLDCLARKRLGPGAGVLPARARYTMTVPDAAAQLGISESAVRQAICSSRLRARKDGGTYYLDPQSVAAYRVSRRGPRRRDAGQRSAPGGALRARIGSRPDASFRVKHPGEALEVEEGRGSEWTFTIPAGWHRAAVLATSKDRSRYWEIEPAEGESTLSFEGFYLRGGFHVIEVVSASPKARSAFRAFEPR